MVRWVFRPYTQVYRLICTSKPMRTSTRVSSGFVLLKHRSPSFGSQPLCSISTQWQAIRIGPWCVGRPREPPNPMSTAQVGLYFHYADIEFWALFDSHNSYTPRSVFQDGPDRWPTFTSTHIATRTIECTTLTATNQSIAPTRHPSTASDIGATIGRTRECALIVNAVNAVIVGDHRYARTINDGSPIRERLCHKTMSALSASTPVVSRSLELSFQSSLQLSLTVLVCYRIRIRI